MRTPKPVPEASSEAFSEQHYSVAELAKLWGVSEDTIRRLFRNEVGVLVLSRARPGKRRYMSLRIPQSVARRVHQKLSVVRG